jgi:Kelch motif
VWRAFLSLPLLLSTVGCVYWRVITVKHQKRRPRFDWLVRRFRMTVFLAVTAFAFPVSAAGADPWEAAPSAPGATAIGNTSLAELDGVLYTGGDSQLYSYTVDTGVWRTLAPLPFGREALRIVAGADGRLYAIGGSTGYTTAYANVDAYDPHSDTWTAAPPLPLPRNSPAAVSAPDGRIYVAGGQKDFSYPGEEFTTTTFAYRPGDISWSTLAAPGFFGRFNATGMLLHDGRILVAGGFNAWEIPPDGSPRTDLSSAQVFDPNSSTWTSVQLMHQPRQAPADGAVGCDGRGYVAGGLSGPANDIATETVEQFDPVTGVWTYAPSLPWLHAAGGMALAPGGRLYLVGGSTPSGASNQLVYLNTRASAQTWCGFADGFERGTLAGWAAAKNASAQTNDAYVGAYGAHFSSKGSGGSYARLTLPAPQDNVFYRAWFRPETQGTQPVALLQLRTSSTAMISILRLPTGQLALRNDQRGTRLTSRVTLPLAVWHRVELRIALSAGRGQISVLVDGMGVADLSSGEPLTGRVSQLQLGDGSNGPRWSFAADNINADKHFLEG